jgi:hypothetical protein
MKTIQILPFLCMYAKKNKMGNWLDVLILRSKVRERPNHKTAWLLWYVRFLVSKCCLEIFRLS